MEEKRRSRRREISVTIQLDCLNEKDEKVTKDLPIEVMDISSKGIGFLSKEKLDADGYYNTKMEIWTKEVIPCVIHIVREEEVDGVYHYGGMFVGMSSQERWRIDVYEIVEDMRTEEQDGQ